METKEDRASPAAHAAANILPQQSLLYAALEACPSGVLLIDAGQSPFHALYANPAFRRMTGGQQQGQLSQVFGSHAASAESAINNFRANRAAERATLRDPHTGSSYDLNICVPIDNNQHLLCYLTDISALARHQQTIEFLAPHDEVTGLPNRHSFDDKLRNAMAQASQDNAALALLSLSIDNLKAMYGDADHDTGDAFLAAVAMRLTSCVAMRDTVLRQGGSEFTLIIEQVHNPYQLAQLCKRILEALAEPFDVTGPAQRPVCTIGVALYPDDVADAGTLLRYSRLALIKARELGGNRFEMFSLDMNARLDERTALAAALREAFANRQLALRYQPLADLRDGSIAAVEALTHWHHPPYGEVSPHQLASIAEYAGLSTEIFSWQLEQVTKDLGAWRTAGIALPKVALNMSLAQLGDAEFPDQLAQALAAADLPAQQLSVEVSEACLMAEPEATAHTLGLLKTLGLGLTLDHFPTRHSSLSHLKRAAFDLVKIEHGLIAKLDSAPEDAAMVKSVIAMAHNLGIAVAAEGVADESQCDFLRKNMCDQIQGEFFSDALSADDLAQLISSGQSVEPHLLRIQQKKRTLLLVDDEPNIVSALKRLLRRDGYQILTANSGAEGLEVLAANEVDVIVSDQRMPGMIGADFLRAAKELYPDTIRIMLSGYTELQSVTDAVNEGAIYKFLTKPWDDEQLRGHIAEAFRLKEIADENERLNLELRTANYDMALTNRKMEELLRQKQQQISRDEISLSVAREVLQQVPLPVIGLDDCGMVAFLNGAASQLFHQGAALLGNEAPMVMPELFPNGWESKLNHEAVIGKHRYQVVAHSMGEQSQSRGSLITLSRCEEP